MKTYVGLLIAFCLISGCQKNVRLSDMYGHWITIDTTADKVNVILDSNQLQIYHEGLNEHDIMDRYKCDIENDTVCCHFFSPVLDSICRHCVPFYLFFPTKDSLVLFEKTGDDGIPIKFIRKGKD